MTQLNIGNKGCENLESKQESLASHFQAVSLSSLALFAILSLSRRSYLIFLAAVSLETSFRLFGRTVQMWMMPSEQ